MLVSKLGPVWVGRLRVSAHAGWAGRWCGWCACAPLVGRTVVAWLSLVFVSAPFSLASVAELVDAPDSKSGIRWGVWVRVPPEVLAPRRKRWSAYKASVVEWQTRPPQKRLPGWACGLESRDWYWGKQYK